MKSCQLCGGAISGGRCTWCGMPLRDEKRLYHLNEDRSDHYVHSSKRIQSMMRQQETPLPDLRSGRVTSSDRTQLDDPRPAPNVSQSSSRPNYSSTSSRPNVSQSKSRPNYSKNTTKPNVPGGGRNGGDKKKASVGTIIWLILLYGVIALINSRS